MDFHHSIEGSGLNICTREMTNIAVIIEDLGNHKVYIFSSQETINLDIQTSASSMIPKAMYILGDTELGAVNFLWSALLCWGTGGEEPASHSSGKSSQRPVAKQRTVMLYFPFSHNVFVFFLYFHFYFL